jgi:hypothetical protein
MTIPEGLKPKEYIEAQERIIELVTQLPQRVFVSTENAGILEVITTIKRVYDGQTKYIGGGDKEKQPPPADGHEMKVKTVHGESRLSIKYIPAYTKVELHEASPRRPRGLYPEDVNRQLSIQDGSGNNIGSDQDSGTLENLKNVVAFLEKAVDQGKADKARGEARATDERQKISQTLRRALL